MPETTPTCRIHEKYSWLKCANAAQPGDADGFCILHSQDKNKNPDDFKAALQARWQQADQKSYDFQGVFFPGHFDPDEVFGSREFNKPADFFVATFTERADFSGATFMRRADFSRATFTEGADFSMGTFMRRADFFGATFRKWANFIGATFTRRVDFIEASFSEGANFIGTRFNEGANFIEASFTKGADFSGATIEGRVVLRDINSRKRHEQPALPFIGYFPDLEFQENGALRFQDMYLAHCTFSNTDLRRAEFHHVQWHSYRGRQAIYDEILLKQEEKESPLYWPWFWTWVSCHLTLRFFALESGTQLPQYLEEEFPPPDPPLGDHYGEVERLYRNLQENYKQAGDYKNLGDFHYGEMEMHRRASKWRWFPGYWYNLYLFLSGYGERPSWALGWLVVFLVVMGGVVWGLGLEVGNPPHSRIAGFGDSFIYLLQKATLQRPTWADPVGFGGKLVAGLSVLLIPGQAALFLLALRNRLGRRR